MRSMVEGATAGSEPAFAPSVAASRRHLPRFAGEDHPAPFPRRAPVATASAIARQSVADSERKPE